MKLSQHGVGLSAGVTRARFGVDAGVDPYVHTGRHGFYYRKRWRKRWPIPPSPSRDPLALPSEPPSSDTHRRVGWGWVLVLLVLSRASQPRPRA